MRRSAKWSLALLLLAALAGCQKVNVEKTWTIEAGGLQELTIDAPNSDQKVKVVATSTESPISVYVILDKDEQAARKSLEHQNDPDKALLLGTAPKAKEVTVEATVPAKNGYRVIVGFPTKKTEVKVTVTAK
jgi:hypothetical protein